MRHRWLQMVVLAGLVCGSAPSVAQDEPVPDPFTVQGQWWLSIPRNRGVMKLDIQPIAIGIAEVRGGGVSRDFAKAFRIDEDVQQFIFFDSTGNISSGVGAGIMLEDLDDNALGTMAITSGKLNGRKTRLRLKGTLTLMGLPVVPVRWRGGRIPASPPDYEGRSTDARVRGSGLRSNKYDFQLTLNADLGFPCFDLVSGGPVRVDGVEQVGVLVVGTVAVAPNAKFVAEVMSDPASSVDLGVGGGTGRIKESSEEGGRPTAVLKATTDLRDRVRFRSLLRELVGN